MDMDMAASSSAAAAAAAAALPQPRPSRYESQKRRDWRTFTQYLRGHRPPLALARCSGAHVLEFLRHLDRFGKTRVHVITCPHFGHAGSGPTCQCPLRQAWGSLDALVGRLRAAFEEFSGGADAETNPFAARAVRLYLRGVRDGQAKARGITYQKRKKKTKTSKINKDGDVTNAACHHNEMAAVATQREMLQFSVNAHALDFDADAMTGHPGRAVTGGEGFGVGNGFYLPLLFDTFN